MPIQPVNSASFAAPIAAITPSNPRAEELKKIIETLPVDPVGISQDLASVNEADLKDLIDLHTEELPVTHMSKGAYHYDTVLVELDRLKPRLGGSPVFGSQQPSLDDQDLHKTFLGVPMPAVKDWFRMVLKNHWIPEFFWQFVASFFNVSTETTMSQYEEAHIRIQRFGLLMEHKNRFVEILDSKDKKHYDELSRVCGLAWHPTQNAAAVEKSYIELIDQFFTTFFEDAKAKGDDALVEFFSALKGVCFEDRARCLEEYVAAHPTEELKSIAESIQSTSDWDTGHSVAEAFTGELTALGVDLQRFPTPVELKQKLEEKDIFITEFQEEEGRCVPSLETYHKFALSSIQAMCLDFYSYQDFLEIELEIFKASGKEQTQENFIQQLQNRIDLMGDIELYIEGGDTVVFDISSEICQNFLAALQLT